MAADIQILDPGYMIGGAETSIHYACMPRLAVPVKGDNGEWGWKPSDYVEKVTQDDATHISFTLKQGSNGATILASSPPTTSNTPSSAC